MARNRRQALRHGYVVIDKPAGWTSHDVVARVRRIVGERRVGHAGTLDPAATGVLPVAVGLATRTVEYLANASKAYRAWITFGAQTDTADAEGKVIAETDPSGLGMDRIEAALTLFVGPTLQRPPMHSAIKVNGTRLYQLARQGLEVEVAPREVTIHALSVVDWSPPVLCLDIECSKGTYIRSLARDLGEVVGSGAHLSRLVRTRTGSFTLDDAMTLEVLASRLESESWQAVATPPDVVLGDFPRIDLDPAEAEAWGHGKALPVSLPEGTEGAVRAYDAEGRWIGIGQVDATGQLVRPVKVVPRE